MASKKNNLMNKNDSYSRNNDKDNTHIPESSNIKMVLTILSIVGGILGIMGVFYAILALFTNTLQSQIDRQWTEISALRDGLANQKGMLENISGQLTVLIAEEKGGNEEALLVIPEKALIESISITKELRLNEIVLSEPEEEGTIIASGYNGEKYSKDVLENERIIFTYNEDGHDVLFCGKFNENNHWDGLCIVNAYAGGVLSIATEATYDDGRIIEYTQVFNDGNRWVYSNRTSENNINSGDTWTYKKEADVEKTASFENISVTDLIIPDNFVESLGILPTSEYHGLTSEGFYNDATGDAYLVSYYDDGKIKTMYQGGFANGEFEDDTGNAWEIACDRDNNVEYLYYRGDFAGGKADSNNSHEPVKENNLSVDRIMEIINGTPLEGKVERSELVSFD